MISNEKTTKANDNKEEYLINEKKRMKTQSTDTEPEAEHPQHSRESRKKSIPVKRIRTKEETNNEVSPKESNDQRMKIGNIYYEFSTKLPTYEYSVSKATRGENKRKKQKGNEETYPLDSLDTNNNRFTSYNECFFYIACHCRKHDQRYTREKCREYLKECFILDFSHDEFVRITSILSTKEFNKYYQQSQREIKYM